MPTHLRKALVLLLVTAVAVTNAFMPRSAHAMARPDMHRIVEHGHDHTAHQHGAAGHHDHAAKPGKKAADHLDPECCAACIAAAFIFSTPRFDRPAGAETLAAAAMQPLRSAAPAILIPPPRFS